MWTWILGAAGLAGVAGLVYASRKKKKRTRQKSDAKQTEGRQRPRLAKARQCFWDAMELADNAKLPADEKSRRESERSDDLEALSRIIASEAGTKSQQVQRTVAWIARNRALGTRMSLWDMAAPDGTWGPITSTRPMSSSQPSTLDSRRIAAAVLDAPQSEDPIDGAMHGFDVPLQDRLAETGQARYDADDIRDLWTTYYGLEPAGQVESWVLYR